MPDQPITIRRLGPEDAELLERPLPGTFDYAFDASQVWGFLAVRTNVLVAALEGRHLVGFGAASLVMHPVRPPELYVSAIEVHADRRRRGVGLRLVRRLVDAAEERGCARLWLLADEGNAAARALCAGIGAGAVADSTVFVLAL